MSLKNYSHEEVTNMAMVELANLVLSDTNKEVPFKELFDEIAVLKEFTDDQRATYIAQLYTDLNIDGRFINRGSNSWALKRWYPVDQVIKETKPAEKKKTKAKTKGKPKAKKKPEVEEEVEEESDSLEELTADFSKMDGEDDVDEEVEDFAVFAEELDDDADFGDEELDDEVFDDEEDADEEVDDEQHAEK